MKKQRREEGNTKIKIKNEEQTKEEKQTVILL
jgi:hypothetical protein